MKKKIIILPADAALCVPCSLAGAGMSRWKKIFIPSADAALCALCSLAGAGMSR